MSVPDPDFGERIARVEERLIGLVDLVKDLRALVRGLTWTLAGVAAFSAALGAIAAALVSGQL
jgi:hypothetical protein